MSWQLGFVSYSGATALVAAGISLGLQYLWQRRMRSLRQEVARLSEDMLQMAELQMEIYQRVSRGLSEVEEKVLDLSVPSTGVPLPLERRHQVLTLARKGISVDEIARRLNMPKGEAELILSLRKYTEARTPDPAHPAAQQFAQASS